MGKERGAGGEKIKESGEDFVWFLQNYRTRLNRKLNKFKLWLYLYFYIRTESINQPVGLNKYLN